MNLTRTQKLFVSFFGLLVLICLMFLFSACNNNNQKTTEPDNPEPEEVKVFHTLSVDYGVLDNLFPEEQKSFQVEEGTVLSLSQTLNIFGPDGEFLTSISLTAPTGYILSGIFDESGSTFSSIEVLEDVTINVSFTAKNYSITFVYDGKQTTTNSGFRFDSQQSISNIIDNNPLQNFSRNIEGMVFVGWTTTPVEEFSFSGFNTSAETEEQITNDQFVENYINRYQTITVIKISTQNTLYALYAPEKYNGVSVEGMDQTSFYYLEPFLASEFGYQMAGSDKTYVACPDLGQNNQTVNKSFQKISIDEDLTKQTRLYIVYTDPEKIDQEDNTKEYDFVTLHYGQNLKDALSINEEFLLNIDIILINNIQVASRIENEPEIIDDDEGSDDPIANILGIDDELDESDDEGGDEPWVDPVFTETPNQKWQFRKDLEGYISNYKWIFEGENLKITFRRN